MRALSALRTESTVTLFRETLWRTQRRWKQIRLPALMGQKVCPVQYQPGGYYQPRLNDLTEKARQAILNYADLVKDGRFSCLGYPAAYLGMPPRWSFDFVSGKDWSLEPSESLKVVRHDGSDVKVPWELSRLQFLPVLGKAWRLSSNPQYRECSRALLSDWIEKNPVGLGVNWSVAMEAALRAISICISLELLWPFLPTEQVWLETVTRSLWKHLLFIEAHNEFSHLTRSNHYLSNIAGLYCLSAYLFGPGMNARAVRYSQLLQREMQHQVSEDGGDYEASVGYHVLVAQLFMISLPLMRNRRNDPSTAFLNRLGKMYEYMSALADVQGRLPQVGDCDDGRAELLSDDIEQVAEPNVAQRDSLAISSLLGIGGCLLRKDFGGRDDDACWHGVDYRRTSFVRQENDQATRVFPITGVASIQRAGSDLLLFAMPNGIDGKGSHTHNDKLSVILRVNGHELLADSGTFCYTRDAAKRNHFRSTLAHNTVRIDGQEQNRFSEENGGLFRMQDDASTSRVQVDDKEDSTQLCAEHHGYHRLGVTHKRCVVLSDASQAMIEDDFLGSGQHLIEAAWHLPPVWNVEFDRESGKEISCTLRGPLPVEVRFTSTTSVRVASNPAAISRRYGSISEGRVVIVSTNAELPFRLSTRISWAHD